MKKAILLAAFLIVLSACAPVAQLPSKASDRPVEPVGCTEDAKVCPDGSVVVRMGPDCEFAPCPEHGKDYCVTVDDCICDGIDTQTGDCFVGNKDYYDVFVDQETQCADFCTGIDGRLHTECVENKCTLVRGEVPEGGPWIEIRAEPSKGEVPLFVHFTAILRGAGPNDERFYCVRRKWDFGDGNIMAASPGCIEYTPDIIIGTHYETDYRYENPGKYDVSFELGDLSSKFYSIMVLPELLPPECDEDSDCVPAQCCHAADCIIKEKRTDCSNVFCTQVCLPGTIDCGGSCACVYGRCTGQNFYDGEAPTGKVPWQALS